MNKYGPPTYSPDLQLFERTRAYPDLCSTCGCFGRYTDTTKTRVAHADRFAVCVQPQRTK